jgi:hypothetical protein
MLSTIRINRSGQTVVWTVAIALVMMQQPLNAVCVELQFSELLANPEIVFIFHGTVVEIQASSGGEIVSLERPSPTSA